MCTVPSPQCPFWRCIRTNLSRRGYYQIKQRREMSIKQSQNILLSSDANILVGCNDARQTIKFARTKNYLKMIYMIDKILITFSRFLVRDQTQTNIAHTKILMISPYLAVRQGSVGSIHGMLTVEIDPKVPNLRGYLDL